MVHEVRDGILYIRIPPCLTCKRTLIEDSIRGVSNDDQDSVTVQPHIATTRVLFVCPRGHTKFQVGTLDLQKMIQYPPNKVKFEADPRLDAKSFPAVKAY